MGKKEETFVRSLVDGLPLGEAARAAGLPEERARRFLESVAEFAGAVGADMRFGPPPAAEGGSSSEAARNSDGGRSSDTARHSGAARRSGASTYTDLVLHSDGASLGNPGPSGAGGVMATPAGEVVEEFHVHLGHATNNVAEYEAVRIGIARALKHGARRIVVRLDSELVAYQLTGRYKVRNRKLLDAYLRVKQLLSQLDEVAFETIPRKENARADALARMGAQQGPG